MFYVVSQLWVFLLLIFVVGVLTAALVRQPEERRWMAPWLTWAILAYVAAASVATIGAVVGRAGFYVESGLASFVAFLFGCFIGTRFTRGSIREHKGWAIGLVPAIMIWLIGNVVTAPRLEADLKQRTAEAIEAAGGDPSKFEIAGRDVTLPEDAPKRQALIDAVLNVEGVRLVAGIEQPKPPKAEPKEPASAERQTEAAPAAGDETARTETKTDIAPSGDAAAEKPPVEPKIEAGAAPKEANAPKEAVKKATSQQRQEPPAPQPELQPSPPAEQIPLREPLVAVIPPAPSDPEAMKSVAAETPPVAKLGPGELDAASCQAAISSALGKDKIQFGEGSAKIRFVSTPLLDKIAALLKRCPSTKFEIAVHTDAPGAANETMTQRRAERLVEYFEREGVARGRLIGVGYGAKKPLRPNKGESDRAANRRVEFLAK